MTALRTRFTPWLRAAMALGWTWSDADDGFARGPLVAETAQRACAIDGVGTPEAATLVALGAEGRA